MGRFVYDCFVVFFGFELRLFFEGGWGSGLFKFWRKFMLFVF